MVYYILSPYHDLTLHGINFLSIPFYIYMKLSCIAAMFYPLLYDALTLIDEPVHFTAAKTLMEHCFLSYLHCSCISSCSLNFSSSFSNLSVPTIVTVPHGHTSLVLNISLSFFELRGLTRKKTKSSSHT